MGGIHAQYTYVCEELSRGPTGSTRHISMPTTPSPAELEPEIYESYGWMMIFFFFSFFTCWCSGVNIGGLWV